MKAYLLLLATLLTLNLNAQMINSGASISITEGTVMGVDSDFLNTGKIANQGDFFLKGSWLNVGVYESPEGTLILNGSDQRIMNNGQSINNLELRNGPKNITDDLTIAGTLDFTQSSILVVAEEARLTLGQGVLIAGTGDQGYVDGRVFRNGTGDLFFPLGSEGKYLPATLVDVIGDEPTVAMHAVSERPSQTIGENLNEIVVDHYWILNADQSYSGGFLTVPYETDSTHLVIAQATSADGLFNTIGSREKVGDLTSGNITSEANAVGPYFTLARAPETKPLPPLKVVNVLTPMQDGKHDYLRIENIELYPDNTVEVFDRHGNKVFSIKNYNNRDRVFRGDPNVGLYGTLPDGNYFYTIKTGAFKVTSGFLFLKR